MEKRNDSVEPCKNIHANLSGLCKNIFNRKKAQNTVDFELIVMAITNNAIRCV